jgi:hypothetical protein
MQVAIPLQSFDTSNIFIGQRTENTVVAGGGFYRVMYCSPECSILGVPIIISIKVGATNSSSLQESYENACEDTFTQVSTLLNTIYDAWNQGRRENKSFSVGQTNCVNLVKQAVQKAFDVKLPKHDVQYNFLFKCSGVFDTRNEAGITYRFNFLNHQ